MLKRNYCPVCKNEKLDHFLSTKDYFLSNQDFDLLKCKKCGVLLTNPFPDEAESSTYYESENYLSHQKNSFSVFSWLYQFIKRINIRHKYNYATKGLVNGRVLDIGCGIGDFLSYCESRKWTVAGIEPNMQARAIAQEKIGQVVYNPMDTNTLEDGSFQLITMWHVLEHVQQLAKQLADIDRLLSKNGKVVIALPNYESYDAKHYQSYWAAYDVPRHLYHFNRSAIITLFSNFSFKLVDESPMIWDAYYVSILSEKYMKNHGIIGAIKASLYASISNFKAVFSSNSSSVIYTFVKDDAKTR